jgi:hypothetical protein
VEQKCATEHIEGFSSSHLPKPLNRSTRITPTTTATTDKSKFIFVISFKNFQFFLVFFPYKLRLSGLGGWLLKPSTIVGAARQRLPFLRIFHLNLPQKQQLFARAAFANGGPELEPKEPFNYLFQL